MFIEHSAHIGATPLIQESEFSNHWFLLKGKANADTLLKLEDLLQRSQGMKHSVARTRRIKLIKSEITKVKKNLTTDSSQSDGDNDVSESKSSSQNSSKKRYLIVKKVVL